MKITQLQRRRAGEFGLCQRPIGEATAGIAVDREVDVAAFLGGAAEQGVPALPIPQMAAFHPESELAAKHLIGGRVHIQKQTLADADFGVSDAPGRSEV